MLIIHTSDFHGKLTYKKAKKIYKYKEKGAILLDSGDAICAGNFDLRFYEKTLFLMSQIGYTAGAVGNREFHPIPFFFKFKLKNSSFPHLSANLFYTKKLSKILPYLDLKIEDFNITLIGLTVPVVKEMWKKISPLYFLNPIFCGEKLAEKFYEKSNLIIFLTHMGIEEDIKLAKKLKKFSLILGGHSHILMKEPLKVDNVYIFHSGCYAENISIIELKGREIKVFVEKL